MKFDVEPKLIVFIRGREFVLVGLTQRECETVIKLVEALLELVPALDGVVVTHVS